ncbi:MAG: hypothetical protein GY862_08005, partial [Gammaproteobacteria bacterium]|nr:hypothetical protein [Gammaproteobacteria bacterium]
MPRLSVLTYFDPSSGHESALPGYLENILQQSLFDDTEFLICYTQWHPLLEQHSRAYPNIVCIKDTLTCGTAAAWNQMLMCAVAPFVSLWGVSDRRHPNALRIQYEEICSTQSLLVHNRHVRCRHPLRRWDAALISDLCRESVPCAHTDLQFFYDSDPIWQKSLVEEIGFFDEFLYQAPDWDMWCKIERFAGGSRIGHINEPLSAICRD